jgi:ATP-dependent helicase/nuclease subunit B
MTKASGQPVDSAMPLTTTPTTYGRPAAVELHARIRAVKDGDPLSPVTVVVPTNYAGASIRRLLGSGELGPLAPNTRGVVGLQFTTVSRLAETLGASSLTAAGRRPAATPVVAATIRGVLDDAPGIFAPVAGHSATVDALVQAHRELNALRPAQLDALAGCGPRPADVVRIHRATRARLVTDFYEVADLLAHAIAAVPGSPAIADLGGVIAYLPQRLSELEAHLLTAIGTRTDLHLIVGRTCAADADAEVLWTGRFSAPRPPTQRWRCPRRRR